ncbi:MAG: HD domain-containing phosphohydrolase [Desulfotomaculales bacterium]
MDYTAFLERAGFRQLQEEIARATGLAVITTDRQGRALFGKSNPPAFCVLINGTPEGRMACSTFRRGLARDIRAAGGRMLLPQLVPAVRSALVVPLRVRDRILGTLGVYDTAPRAWDEAAAGFLTAVAAKVALALENGRLYASLREYYLSALQALAAALEARDTYTRGHSVRVAGLSRACARALGLSGEEQEQVYLAGLLHDIGKIGVPDSILLKPGRLDAREWEEVKNHPEVGARILEPARFPAAVVAAVRHHHEDYAGTGYPAGLAGEEIPLLARIIRVADAYDAMTSARPYRGALTPEEAVEELRRGVGRQFDPRVVEAFLRIPAGEKEKIGRGGGGGALITRLTDVLRDLAGARNGFRCEKLV